MIHIIAFTAKGVDLALRLCALYPDATLHAPERYCRPPAQSMGKGSLGHWTAAHFAKGNSLIYIGSAGIAVRAIAPFVRSKDVDPAVLCMDELGRYVIPLLSGHLGGGNALARELAAAICGEAVLTTATDINGIFSPDAWAAKQNCAVADISAIKAVSAALLDGQPVGFASDFPLQGTLPPGLREDTSLPLGIYIGWGTALPFPHTLHLLPRCLVAGIGCRKGIDADTLLRRLEQDLAAHSLPLKAVGAVASIDLKAGEPGLLELCSRLHVPLLTYSAEALMAQEGSFTPSTRVLRVTGADNVCERAAAAAGGAILSPKSAGEGVTVALARREWVVRF